MKTNLDLGKSIKETQNKDCVHLFTVTLDEHQTKDLCLNALAKLQHVVKIPGFRVGKVPLSMIKNQFPSEVRDEAIDIAAKAALPEIFKQNKDLNPVVQPMMRDVKYEEDKSLSFEIQIETPPVFEVKDYTKLKASKKAPNPNGITRCVATESFFHSNAFISFTTDISIEGTICKSPTPTASLGVKPKMSIVGTISHPQPTPQKPPENIPTKPINGSKKYMCIFKLSYVFKIYLFN